MLYSQIHVDTSNPTTLLSFDKGHIKLINKIGTYLFQCACFAKRPFLCPELAIKITFQINQK